MAKKEEVSKAELYRKERKERLAKEAKKNAKRNAKVARAKRIAIRTVSIVIAVAIVLSATVAIVNATGSSLFRLSVATVGNEKVTTSELQYYYRTSHANLVSQATQYDSYYGSGYYANSEGFDYTKLPSEQKFPNEMLEGQDIDETFDTWEDYIIYSTLNSVQYFYTLAKEAEKSGMKLTDDEVKEITDQIEELRATATEAGMTLNAYLRRSYGSGINENNLENWMMRDALAQKYAEAKQLEIYDGYTSDDVNKEFKENAKDYSFVDARFYVFNVETDEVKEGASESEVKAAQEKAQKKAEKEANEFLAKIKTEKNFISAATALDKANEDEESSTSVSTEDSTKLEKAQYAALEASFGEKNADWAFAKERKTGDKKVFEFTSNGEVSGYYAIFITAPSYRDEKVASDLKAYNFAYETSADDESKAETKKEAQALVDEWNSLPAKEKTAEEFSHISNHVYPDDTTLTCTDYSDYADGTISSDVDKWANDKSRKAGEVKLFETTNGCYVVYYEGRNAEANWQMTIKGALRDEAFSDYTDELVKGEDYVLVKDGGLKEFNLNLHKNKMNRDLETYLYALLQSQQQSAANSGVTVS